MWSFFNTNSNQRVPKHDRNRHRVERFHDEEANIVDGEFKEEK
jgi:hypothetical protein